MQTEARHPMRGADLLVRALSEIGTTHIFALSGNQIMPVFDACIDVGITIVHTRHEAAAVYMAEAFAQLTGQIGVALVTAGGGASNAVGPLFSAGESETPILLLTGDSPVAQDGAGAFQEMPQVAMIAPMVKFSERPGSAQELARAVPTACRIARSGREGPVHLSLAADVLTEIAGRDLPIISDPEDDAAVPPLDELHAALAEAERPVILCGPSLNATRFAGGAALADAVDAPVIVMESPRGMRDPSLGVVKEVLARADLIVLLGKRCDFTLNFGATGSFDREARWFVVTPCRTERDRAKSNLGARLHVVVSATGRATAEALIETGARETKRPLWHAEVATALAARPVDESSDGRITPASLCVAVQRQIDRFPKATLVCDGGEFGQWAQAMLSAPGRIINGTSGSIGGGLCYAVAARLARPDATVFALMGDGTVGFHIAEFEAAARLGIPFVAVIGNDRRWNAEHLIQKRSFGEDRLIACDLSGARYDLAVEALGGHGEYVTDANDLDGALKRAIDSGKPACVNVEIAGKPAP